MAIPDHTTLSELHAPTIADQWRLARQLAADVNTHEGDGDPPALEGMFAAEAAVLQGPIQSHDDLVAKLCGVGLSVERGSRADGLDVLAYADAVRWLEAPR